MQFIYVLPKNYSHSHNRERMRHGLGILCKSVHHNENYSLATRLWKTLYEVYTNILTLLLEVALIILEKECAQLYYTDGHHVPHFVS